MSNDKAKCSSCSGAGYYNYHGAFAPETAMSCPDCNDTGIASEKPTPLEIINSHDIAKCDPTEQVEKELTLTTGDAQGLLQSIVETDPSVKQIVDDFSDDSIPELLNGYEIVRNADHPWNHEADAEYLGREIQALINSAVAKAVVEALEKLKATMASPTERDSSPIAVIDDAIAKYNEQNPNLLGGQEK